MSINVNQLEPNSVYFVRGKVIFSRVATQTTDKEREQWNKTRKFAIDKNYTTLRICEASVICSNPSNPTIVEQYAAERLYSTSSGDVKNPCFSAINKSPSLPAVFALNTATGQYDPVVLDAELANGLDVTIAMRVFPTKGNNGVTMAQIYVNEPLRTFESNRNDRVVADAAAQALGIVFSAPAPANRPNNSGEGDPTDLVPEAPAEPQPTASPFSTPTQTQAQAPVQQPNPFSGGGSPFTSGRTY